jgi:HEPN domain-containing protein
MNEHSEQAQALLDAAVRDCLTLQLLRESGRAPNESMGFHAQQACEKYLKAVLVSCGIIFDRSHDLVALAALGAAHGIANPVDDDQLRQLNSYAVKFRYEGCAVALVDPAEMQVLVEKLREWSADLIATSR